MNSSHELSDVDGIRIVTERVPSVRSVSLGIWIGVGSRDEDPSTSGFAHFVEHLLFKGNERFGAEQISEYFDGIGSDANAATTKEYTVVHTRVLDRHVDEAFEVLGNMVLAPRIDPGDFDAEREVILEEIAMYNDSPSDVVHELVDHLTFPDHPLGSPIAGSQESILSATRESVREFHGGYYANEQIVVSAAGNCDHQAIADAVRRRLLPARELAASRRIDAAGRSRRAASAPAGRSARVLVKETEQVHLCLASSGISREDPRRYALAVLDTILGSTPSSRLFTEIREQRGLAYSVYSFVSQYADTGQVGVYVGVRPDRVQTTLDVLAEQLERVRSTTPTSQELARAKDHLEGRTLLSMESTTVRGNRLGSSLVTGVPIESVETVIERIRSVSADSVRDLAAELLDPSRLVLAAVAEDAAIVEGAAVASLGIDPEMFAPSAAVAG